MLEEKLREIVKGLNRLTEAIDRVAERMAPVDETVAAQQKAAGKKSTPKAKVKEPEVVETQEEVEASESASDVSFLSEEKGAITLKDINAGVNDVLEAFVSKKPNGRARILDIFKKFKVKTTPELPEEKYPEVLALLQGLLAEVEEG